MSTGRTGGGARGGIAKLSTGRTGGGGRGGIAKLSTGRAGGGGRGGIAKLWLGLWVIGEGALVEGRTRVSDTTRASMLQRGVAYIGTY